MKELGLDKTKDHISENGKELGWVLIYINLQELRELKHDNLNTLKRFDD